METEKKTNSEKLKDCLDKYIKNENDKFAFLINGVWGSGKTYLIEEYIKNRKGDNEKNDSIYVSLNGVTDLDKAFRNSLVGNKKTIQDAKDLIIENGKNVVKNMVKDFIGSKTGVDIDDLFCPNIPATLIYKAIKKNNIFIDDIERCKCDPDDVFGYIDDFLRNGFKVILIMNSEALEDKKAEKYKEIKEKIINRQITIKPDNSTFDSIVDKALEETHFTATINKGIFEQTIKDNRKNWFYVLNTDETGFKVVKSPNLRLFNRTIINSLSIIDSLEERQLISDYNKKQIYNEIINNVYLYLHKETFANEIDEKKYEEYKKIQYDKTVNKVKKAMMIHYEENKDLEEKKYGEYSDAVDKTIRKKLERTIIPLTCVNDYFEINDMSNEECYKDEFNNIENIPDELNFSFSNVYKEDIDNCVNTIIQNLKNRQYKPTLIFKILDELMECEQYTYHNYIKENKDYLADFISNNDIIINRSDDYSSDDHIAFHFMNTPEAIDTVKELMGELGNRNAEIAFKEIKKYLETFNSDSNRNFSESIYINTTLLDNVIDLNHEEIIGTVIAEKKHCNYINFMENYFRNYLSGSYYKTDVSSLIKGYEEKINNYISNNDIDMCVKIRFEWFLKRINQHIKI